MARATGGSLLSSDESGADPVSLSSGFEVAVGASYKEGRPRREGSQLPPGLPRVLPHTQRCTLLGCSLSELFPSAAPAQTILYTSC